MFPIGSTILEEAMDLDGSRPYGPPPRPDGVPSAGGDDDNADPY